MKTLIEILPGIRVEVERRLSRLSGFSTDEIRARAIGTPQQNMIRLRRAQRRGVLYSRLILDEAVAIAKKNGMKETVRLTGVSRWSIHKHIIDLRQEAGLIKRREEGNRYTMERKRACVALALKLMASPEMVKHVANVRGRQVARMKPRWGQRLAFKEAGGRLGMNGRSIEFMWKNGMIEPSTPPPASPPVTGSGPQAPLPSAAPCMPPRP